ncbi:MAG: DNA repair protein RecO [Gammaproteobacteria bacterium]|nr:DNA repair protein RecO [Gammaproteobacteria bacterium]
MLYENCYVLRRKPYSETSLLLELLTSESRYVHALYRGAKRKGATPIDLFTEYAMSWRPRVGLVTVRSCELKSVLNLVGDALYAGLYINELVRRGMRENQVIDDVQPAYQSTVQQLNDGNTDLEAALRTFEKRFLKALGFELEFHREQATGDVITSDSHYFFDPLMGFSKSTGDEKATYPGHVLLNISVNRFECSDTRHAAKLILRDALYHHLGERAIKARSLLSAKQFREAAYRAVAND